MVKKSKSKITSKTVLASMGSTPQRKAVKVGRNQPCPCGSQKKYKDCHQSEGDSFLLKLAREREKARRLQEQEELGAPWYRKILTRILSD